MQWRSDLNLVPKRFECPENLDVDVLAEFFLAVRGNKPDSDRDRLVVDFEKLVGEVSDIYYQHYDNPQGVM